MAARTIERVPDGGPAAAAAVFERTVVVVAARDEGERVGPTLAAIRRALPGAELWVADDGSRDSTAAVARAVGARVVSARRRRGKGRTVEATVRRALSPQGAAPIVSEQRTLFLLCDGDLAESAHALTALPGLAGERPGSLIVAEFEQRRGGGFGLVRGLAARAIARERRGERPRAPLSGQRALRASELRRLLPFAEGYGLEVGMTIDAVRAGMTLVEPRVALTHHARGRTPAGFLHRGRQALHVRRAVRERRLAAGPSRPRVTSGLQGRKTLR